MALNSPKLMVFDLDYTLWPFWIDTHVYPPFKTKSNGQIVDLYESPVTHYPEVPDVLEKLQREGYILGVASRTSEIKGALQLIDLFGWDKYFTYKEIFPGQKITHFYNIKKQSGLNFTEMMFFDDEQRNIRDISELGVVSVYVKNGVSKKVVEEGKNMFANKSNVINI
ncbi:magnesium-dependent phosphatase 1-like [Anoplophora glabripennis]|uniref:magnesium-dependent phosphatase 1-like n=1 Tax=Anoplophora glabripennis TaxID=217634 RepID=UPI0008755060|nr:magnesium-dependent phosphatase 1-like [Anoplophora glabripennis]XP_018580273.1 magnesium-dependent phosphatase 1-like [Anoplophora glabripennis]